MKKIMRTSLKYAIIFIALIAIFLISLTLVSLIPRETIKKNTQESAEILSEQTNRYFINVRNWIIMFDNYTDALMINTAYSIDTEHPFYSAMVARKNYIPGMTETIYEDSVRNINIGI